MRLENHPSAGCRDLPHRHNIRKLSNQTMEMDERVKHLLGKQEDPCGNPWIPSSHNSRVVGLGVRGDEDKQCRALSGQPA